MVVVFVVFVVVAVVVVVVFWLEEVSSFVWVFCGLVGFDSFSLFSVLVCCVEEGGEGFERSAKNFPNLEMGSVCFGGGKSSSATPSLLARSIL